jgi:rare lipoprotein A
VKNRIIDLSAGAAKKLGFYNQGLARVKVETVHL